MSVIQSRASRFATWLAGTRPVAAATLLRTWLAVTTFFARVLQAWGQKVEFPEHAAVSLAAARNPGSRTAGAPPSKPPRSGWPRSAWRAASKQ